MQSLIRSVRLFSRLQAQWRGFHTYTPAMGVITVFALEECSFCKKSKALLNRKGVQYSEISLTRNPEWKSLMFLLTNGRTSVPEIFFNDRLIGGSGELQQMEDAGELDRLVKETLDAPTPPDFPPQFRKPKSEEFVKVIPKELQQKWQKDVEALDSKLGGTAERPITKIRLLLETPQEMVVVCTTGPGGPISTVGVGYEKGREQKLYCQVAIEKQQTLFIDDPTKIPGLEKNEDWVKSGYGYYVGAPWVVGQTKGTVVAMEKQPNILKPEHTSIIEAFRDQVERDFQQYRDNR